LGQDLGSPCGERGIGGQPVTADAVKHPSAG
jgi:hypothetical protein